jgi:hypothetical protein
MLRVQTDSSSEYALLSYMSSIGILTVLYFIKHTNSSIFYNNVLKLSTANLNFMNCQLYHLLQLGLSYYEYALELA